MMATRNRRNERDAMRAKTYLGFLLRLCVGLSALGALSCSDASKAFDYKEGDIIFQQSQSNPGKAIELATKSRYTHLGIVHIEKGEPFVFEAVQKVQLTPLEKWVARGAGGKVVVKRLKGADKLLTPQAVGKMELVGKSLQGKAYDLVFNWSDDQMYCSELVWKIYERALGIRIGELRTLGAFDLSHPLVAKKMKERYGENAPLGEAVISPQDMFESPLLETVYEN